MPYKLNKIIFQRDWDWGYETYTYDLSSEIDFPFAAGLLQELVPKDKSQLSKYKPEISDTPLFNEKGLGKLVPDVGPKGVYYLELRPGFKLEKLYFEPEDLVVDIYYGGQATVDKTSARKSLLYAFYNGTRRQVINIFCRTVLDSENIWQKIYAYPDDLYWRQFFIKQAMAGNAISLESSPVHRELMNQDQIADYLQVSKKTIQNWSTNGILQFEKLPGTKEVRYRKSEVDALLKSGRDWKKKRR
jgi:excisionase family DNA binding protein